MRVAAHPGLYDPDDPHPVLHGSRCEACGTVYFPVMHIGCEVCGAGDASLHPAELAAAGTIHSVATVHRPASGDFPAPFTMAEIALDDGPLIRAVLATVSDIEVIGRRVSAEWAVVRVDDGADVVEPRFVEAAS